MEEYMIDELDRGKTLLEFREYKGDRYLLGETNAKTLIDLAVTCLIEACDHMNENAKKRLDYADFAKMVIRNYLED